MKFLDPTNDLVFKCIFGQDSKKNVLLSFLNATLVLNGNHAIVEVSIANPHQVPRIRELKETLLDLHCTDQEGNHYIIEVQVLNPGAFDKRVLYYSSKSYVQQIGIGEDYPKLKPVIFLEIGRASCRERV